MYKKSRARRYGRYATVVAASKVAQQAYRKYAPVIKKVARSYLQTKRRVPQSGGASKKRRLSKDSLHQGMCRSTGPITFSKFNEFHRTPVSFKMQRKNQPFMMTRQNGSFKPAGGYNQTYCTAYDYFADADIQTYISQYYAGTVPSGYNPPGSSASANTYRPFIGSIKQNFMISNFGTNTVMVDVYELEASSDHNIGPITAMNYEQTDQGDANLAPGLFPGGKPQDSVAFKKFWKIKKITHIGLIGGAVHKHMSNVYPNRFVYQRDEAKSQYMRGLSRSILILQTGCPAGDASSSATVTGQTELGITKTIWVRYTMIVQPMARTFNTSTLPTLVGAEIEIQPSVGNKINDAEL